MGEICPNINYLLLYLKIRISVMRSAGAHFLFAARQVMMPAVLFLFAGKRCFYAENVEKAQRGMVAVSERARSDLLQCTLSEVQEQL